MKYNSQELVSWCQRSAWNSNGVTQTGAPNRG